MVLSMLMLEMISSRVRWGIYCSWLWKNGFLAIFIMSSGIIFYLPEFNLPTDLHKATTDLHKTNPT